VGALGISKRRGWAAAALALGCSSLDPASDSAITLFGAGAVGGAATNSTANQGSTTSASGGAAAGAGGVADEHDAGAGGGAEAGAGGESSTPVLGPEWACLIEPQKPIVQDAKRVTYVVAVVDFDSQPYSPTAVTGLKIEVCGSPSCDPPASEPDVVIHNPVQGQPPFVYAIEFPFRFSNGSLRLTAAGYAPMDYIFNGPMIGAPEGGYVVQGLTIPLLKATTRDTIYHDLGIAGDVDKTRGVLALRTLNCLRDPKANPRAAGVKLVSIPSAPKAPSVAWTLSTSNRATPNRLETDGRGVAGFVNVPPLVYDLEGLSPVGMGYGRTSIAVRPEVITLAEIRDGIGLWGQ
jgi:hypothetical protein